jgi:ATP-binding cassette subfamily B protein/subfamily B ATP-binding cassette protein MsbA
MASLLPFARPYVRGFGFIAAITIASSLFSLLHPWPLQVLFDHVLDTIPPPHWLTDLRSRLPGAASDTGAIAYVAGFGLAIFALDSFLDVLLSMSWIRVGQRMVYDLACTLYSHVLRRSLLFHLRTPVGDTISRVTGDSWCIYNAASATLFTPIHALIVGGTTVAIMVGMNPTLALTACAVAPVLAVAAVFFGGRIRVAKGLERQAESSLESHVQRTLAGIPVVQAFAQEEREQRRFLDRAHGAVAAQRRSAMIVGLCAGAVGLVITLGTVAVLWVGLRENLAGRLTLGQLTVFLAYLATLHHQCRAVVATYADLRGLGASSQRVKELLRSDDAIPHKPGAATLTIGEAGAPVEFEHVAFGYEPGRPVINDLSLLVPAGRTLGIVGATGAGKSTLAALALRLFDPSSGRILIAGRDLRDLDLDSLRSHIALAPQEPFLFPATIAENIALGRPGGGVSRADIEHAAAVAMAHDFIAALPDGYDTILGERGATLSGGERQRLSLARAIIKNAPILLLDEATSALDAHTEAALVRSLRALPGPRTTIIIAHRLSTVRAADAIAVMQGGHVVECGRHEQLLASSGVYAALWRTHDADIASRGAAAEPGA